MRQYLRVRFRWDDDEGEDWVEGDGLLDPLLQARSELAAGDLRLLYLERLAQDPAERPRRRGRRLRGWPRGLADEVEPPVPAGLRQLSSSLASAAKFLRIDDGLIAVAAKGSRPTGAGQR